MGIFKSQIAAPNTPINALVGKDELNSSESNQFWFCLLASLFILFFTVVIYKPVLFNFFLCNELEHFGWLKEAVNNPILILEGFRHNWIIDQNYYRPLTSIIWATEYLIFGANGLYLRICSITFMLLTCLILGLLVLEMARALIFKPLLSNKPLIWALFSATLFAFYPLHCEPINWFVAQHDVLVTLFCLLSFWSYLRWRNSHNKPLFIFSLISFALGLLTKEMAATLPLVLFGYELLCANNKLLTRTMLLTNAFLNTIPYWLILTAYFFIRKIVLNTFIGVATVPLFDGYAQMLQKWLYSLRQIFVPVNISVISQHGITTIVWQVTIVLGLILSLYAFRKSNNLQMGVFLFIWFIFSLVPAYQVLAINPNLEGARAVYLATVPLCMFFTYGIAYYCHGFRYSYMACTLYGALLFLSMLVLYCNNRAYLCLPYRSDRIVNELRRYYRTISDDTQIKILGLLPVVSGFPILTKKPFLQKNISNCNVLGAYDQYVPPRYLRYPNESKTSFLYWDKLKQKLKPASPYFSVPAIKNFPTTNYQKIWTGKELLSIVGLGVGSPGELTREGSNDLRLVSNRRSYLEINLTGLPCWPIDFVCFKLKINAPIEQSLPYLFDLRFANNIEPDWYWLKCISTDAFSRVQIIPNGKEQDIVFPLRAYPNWTLGGKCRSLKLLLPRNSDIKLMAITLPATNTIIPMIIDPSSVILAQDHSERCVHYDASHIKDCAQVTLEVISAGKNFEALYSKQADKNTLFSIPAGASAGVLKIQRSVFPEMGFYKARLRALDKNGEQVGLAGDHFLINVAEEPKEVKRKEATCETIK